MIEVRSARLPDGGIVTTYTDVTQTVQTEEALEAANELLESRVDERTAELQRLNAELARAKNEADDANLSKTRFLAAASHDILQPLNAARLYASSLSEGASQIGREERADLARNVDVSLEAVEEILGALLDISRLDAGATRPEISDVPVADLMRMLEIEFAAARPLQGAQAQLRADEAGDPHRSAPHAPPAAEPRFQRDQIHAQRPGAGRLPAGPGDGSASRCGTPGSASRPIGSGRCSRSSSGSIRARGSRAAWGSACRSSSAWGACSTIRSACSSRPGEGSVFFVTAPLGDAAPTILAETGAPQPPPGGEPLSGLKILAIDNEPRVLEGMRSLLSRWGCVVATAHGLAEARDRARGLRRAGRHHRRLSSRPGRRRSRRSGRCARIAAGASPRSSPPPTEASRRAAAAAREDVVILNKPLKPAPLRAQLTRYSAMREAAE